MMATYLGMTGGRGQGKKQTDLRGTWEIRLTGLHVGGGEKADKIKVSDLCNWLRGAAPGSPGELEGGSLF